VNPQLAIRDPVWLLALLALPAAYWLRQWRAMPVFLVPFAAAWHRTTIAQRLRWPLVLAAGGFVLFIFALARPQRVQERWITHTRGYDIMLAIDLSKSMLTEDYKRGGERLNRFEAVKPVIRAFIECRPNDRIGVVLFAGRAYTLSPLTFDHAWLARQLDRIRVGMIEDGTALGDGVMVALQRLEQSDRKVDGKRQGAFVVLITDGVNNSGLFTPREARTLASARGVPVYTISAGRNGWVPVPYVDESGQKKYRQERAELDEEELWMMAIGTRGRFFRGYDSNTLVGAFNAISSETKIEFQSRRYVRTAELFPWLAVPGVVLLVIAAVAARPMWRMPAMA
jgi:Ca-activated chloride channel family protein